MDLRRRQAADQQISIRAGDFYEGGFALLIALIALCLFSIVGLYLCLVAASDMRVSDNFEGYAKARAAAMAGLNHARGLMKGLSFNDLLVGPDGSHSQDRSYIAYARTHGYRTPVDWATARMLNLQAPAAGLAGIPDDGVINTGWSPSGSGLALIPLVGIAQVTPNQFGPGTSVASRYFVKVADNNGEASELALDPADNPFVDGDGQIIVRSMGIAQTLMEDFQAGARRNSVVVFEARFKRLSTFDLDAPLVVQGSAVEPASAEMFSGDQFLIQGGASNSAIATLDTATNDKILPSQQILAGLTAAQGKNVQGAGGSPSVKDITPAIAANPDKQVLLDKARLWRWINDTMVQYSDSTSSGSQNWNGSAPVPLGHYDPSLPAGSPGQDPRLTVVAGDLTVDGTLEGAGLLVVTGKLTVRGHFSFYGLVLVVGAGVFDIGGWGSLTGAVLVASLSNSNGVLNWGSARLTMRDSSRLTFSQEGVRMALNLIPPAQLGFREVTSAIDP